MITPTIVLFMGGVDLPFLLLLFVILAVPGFFAWRALLKSLVKKGPRGINIAAFIMGSVQSPILILIVVGAIFWIIASHSMEPRRAQLSAVQKRAEVDVITASPDKAKVLMENEHVRVLEYTLKPGEKDNPHTHPPKSYYVVEGGTLRVYPEKGQPFDAEERQGSVEWGDYVGLHYVQNIGTTTVKLLVTEVKAAR